MCVEVDKVIAEPDAKVALADRVAAPKVVTHMDDPAAVTDDGSVPIYAAIKMYLTVHMCKTAGLLKERLLMGAKRRLNIPMILPNQVLSLPHDGSL